MEFNSTRNFHIHICQDEETCKLCKEKFSDHRALKNHERSCGKVFKCRTCDKPFLRKDTMKTHEKRAHKN